MVAVDQENVSKILSVLSHRIRREILLIIHEKGEASFTDLMNGLKIDTGKLSFHMRALQPFLEQTETGKYRLSRAGEDSVRVIKDVESWAEMSAASAPNVQGLNLASFKKRTLAYLLDFGTMLLLSVPLILPVLISLMGNNWLIISLNMVFATWAILWVYSAILEGFSGQTLGKRIVGLAVVRIDGKRINYEHAAVRNFGKIILPVDLLVGFMLNDPRYMRYFDKFAGTTVIDLKQKSPVSKSKEIQDKLNSAE